MSYQVEFVPSGHRIRVEPGETVLEAALRHGFLVPYGCRSGACGACLGRLLEGKVDYDETPLALEDLEDAGQQVALCMARPRSDLRLEVGEVRALGDIPIRRFPAKVVALERLAHDVMRVLLRLPEGQRLQFLAGQYLDILQPDGGRRSFSIANAPHDDDHLELHIRYVPGGGFSQHVFEEMRLGEIVRIEAPLGGFYLREDAHRPVVMVGGGTGFAPLKAMIEHAFHIGFEAPIHLFWGVRARRDLYMRELPEAWAQARSDFRFTPVLSEPMPGDRWTGATGWVHEAVVAEYPDLSGHDVYMGGPPVMIEAGRKAFLAHGLPRERLFSDAFEYNSLIEKRR